VEDELHVLLECPTYHQIRLKYEHTLFAGFGGVSQLAKSVRLPGKMSAFLNQDPKQVAASECLDYRRFEAPDLDPCVTRETLQEMGLDDYCGDTFSSGYDDTFIDESGYDFDAHGA
jgi:hypothetical protein